MFSKAYGAAIQGIGFSLPSRLSSPAKIVLFKFSSGIWPNAARIAIAIGRSNAVPSFRTSAGDKFTVILLGGSCSMGLPRTCSGAARPAGGVGGGRGGL